jgi:phosphoserine phosphatase
MTDFAIYDMDRTVTQRATYTPFLIHCAVRRAPWRLALLPFVIASMLAYVLKIIDRGRLKEINHRLLIGHKRHAHELKPLIDSFAEKMLASNVRPGARAAIAHDKSEGRRVVMATASYRFYAAKSPNAWALMIASAPIRSWAWMSGSTPRSMGKIATARPSSRWSRSGSPQPDWSAAMCDSIQTMPATRPCFEWADEPVAVNPHDRLQRLASERGWRQEDWG